MIKEFCDLCKEEVTDNTLSTTHWCGNLIIEDIRAEVELQLTKAEDRSRGHLCLKCRRRFNNKLLELDRLEHWVPSYKP